MCRWSYLISLKSKAKKKQFFYKDNKSQIFSLTNSKALCLKALHAYNVTTTSPKYNIRMLYAIDLYMKTMSLIPARRKITCNYFYNKNTRY